MHVAFSLPCIQSVSWENVALLLVNWPMHHSLSSHLPDLVNNPSSSQSQWPLAPPPFLFSQIHLETISKVQYTISGRWADSFNDQYQSYGVMILYTCYDLYLIALVMPRWIKIGVKAHKQFIASRFDQIWNVFLRTAHFLSNDWRCFVWTIMYLKPIWAINIHYTSLAFNRVQRD